MTYKHEPFHLYLYYKRTRDVLSLLTHHSPDDRENKSHVKLGVVKKLHCSMFYLFILQSQ